MPNLNHDKEFASLIEREEKLHTIRPLRKRRFKAGDRLHHLTGQGTENCRKLLETDCIAADTILIFKDGSVRIEPDGGPDEIIDSLRGIASFARADGFRGRGDMELFYNFVTYFERKYGLPFEGQLVKWRPSPVTIKRKTPSNN